ncbi:MAG: TIGR03118 family protein, partial [Pirellulales bacterium]
PEALEPRTVLSSGYFQLTLASDLAASALVQDPNLVGPWGMTANTSGGDLWVVDGGSGLATHYSGAAGATATPFQENSSTIGNIGAQPRGDAFNGSSNFVVQSGAASGPATLLFDSEDGKISGWNTSVPPPSPSPSAQTAATTTSGAIYTGIALENDSSRHLIYAADFHDARVDVFDSGFNRVTLAGSFTDPNLPAGYAPYNIVNTGSKLLVSFAQQDSNQQNAVAGASRGIVDAFNYDGQLLDTLIAGGPSHPTSKLNAPWGMAIAPAGFGDFSGELLVANTGDGAINAFDSTTGAYQGTLSSPAGNPLVANGLHGLSFGNGSAGNSNTLFYTADGSGGQHGVLGEIISAQNSQFPAVGPILSVSAHDTFDGVVAVFNDIHSDPLNSYSAVINWGDGSALATGTVVALPSGGFGVVGSHVYGTVGQYALSVRLVDTQNSTATASGSVSVSAARLVFGSTAPTATEGLQFSGAVATFTDQDGNPNPFIYQATIDWGDGTTTAGTVTGAGSDSFTVNGTHTYASQGSEPMTITVNDFDGSTGTAHITASVVSSMTGLPVTIQTSETVGFSGTVATFTDA